jgi:DNA-3-methyladenine glycosylase II
MTDVPSTFVVTAEAVAHFRRADRTLNSLIERVGPLSIELESDYFSSLAGAIVGQQLSNAAAATIWRRLSELLGTVTPETVLTAGDESLRSAGLSRGKTAYLRDLASHVTDGRLDLAHIATLPDEEAVDQLIAVRGIGRWTVEMFLIFSLGRSDVLALDDGALRSTVAWLYELPAPDRDAVARLGERWKPHRTAASLYLWKALALRRAEERAVRGASAGR